MGEGNHDVKQISLALIDEFICEKAATYSTLSLRNVNCTLRSFLRYLYSQGRIDSELGEKLYPPSSFSHDKRPKYVPWQKIQELLANFQRTTLKDTRDFAMLMLMASYGLRAREIAALRIEDVDFANKKLFLRERKGGKAACFPLRTEACAALKDYLKVRPQSGCPEIFLKLRPPFKPLGKSVSLVVSICLKDRWGAHLPFCGTYLLRHSFAKAMIDRGAPLTKISEVLGHETLNSTLIYTRVATEDLRQVADNYSKLL